MTYYDILEISPTASEEVIKMAYKALAKKYHPDTYTGDKAYAELKMKEINEAYEVLSTDRKRYDDENFAKNPEPKVQEEKAVSSNQPKEEVAIPKLRWYQSIFCIFLVIYLFSPIGILIGGIMLYSRWKLINKYYPHKKRVTVIFIICLLLFALSQECSLMGSDSEIKENNGEQLETLDTEAVSSEIQPEPEAILDEQALPEEDFYPDMDTVDMSTTGELSAIFHPVLSNSISQLLGGVDIPSDSVPSLEIKGVKYSDLELQTLYVNFSDPNDLSPQLFMNGELISDSPDDYAIPVELSPGINGFHFVVENKSGKSTEKSFEINFEPPPPQLEVSTTMLVGGRMDLICNVHDLNDVHPELRINGESIEYNGSSSGTNEIHLTLDLDDGENVFSVTVINKYGENVNEMVTVQNNNAQPVLSVKPDTQVVVSPAMLWCKVEDKVDPHPAIYVNGEELEYSEQDDTIWFYVPVIEGENLVEVEVVNNHGKSDSKTIVVTYSP